ncbi:trypsin-1-like [Adelges cooleyi]|uniref:trypsin-1-like n=1 Tax=Adelges cooleyi TaxID=133065 RepID=UPI00217F6C87|nr:trypsin-1-like [Adelges cooleyi]
MFKILFFGTFLILLAGSTHQVKSEIPSGIPTQSVSVCGALGKKMRIVGGTHAYANKFPWMASIRLKKDYICGASLINNKYVLTAAHCVLHYLSPNLYHVRLIEHDRSKNAYKEYKVKKIVLHKEYDQGTKEFDVALLQLHVNDSEVYSKGVHPVCMPAKGLDFVGYTAVIAGWGQTNEYNYNKNENILHEVKIPILSNEVCRSWIGRDSEITDNMICAGLKEGKKDTCQGDSGGPMHVANGSSYHLAGVVSWGWGCARTFSPGVYVRVNRILKWIKDNTADACPCDTIYKPYIPKKFRKKINKNA